MSKYLPRVLERVKASKIPVPQIAKDTGLNRRWLYDLLNKKITGPDYEKVMVLENYLREHIAKIAEQ